MLERFLEAKSCIQHVSKPIQVPTCTYFVFLNILYVCYVCILCMYSVHVVYVCIPGMYVVYEWTDGAISELLFFRSHFRITFFYKPNERNSPEILFIWTQARRVRNAYNSQGIPFRWTCNIRRCGWNLPCTSLAKVQMHSIFRKLCAFRTRPARVQMNGISGEFR